MTNLRTSVLAAALALAAFTTPALAGKGGSAAAIRTAIASHSSDAIIAEVERAESLACGECVQLVTALTESDRYEVREVAGWWFAKRPGLAKPLSEGFLQELASSNGTTVRNAADFLGSTVTYAALPGLRSAIARDVGTDAKLAIVRAIASLGHRDGAATLRIAMTDANASVRAAGVSAWRELRDVTDGTPLVGSLTDPDATVRAAAATAVGALTTLGARGALETLVISDPDAQVRRNAAWALGKLGVAASRPVLVAASADRSGLVRMTAKAALASLAR